MSAHLSGTTCVRLADAAGTAGLLRGAGVLPGPATARWSSQDAKGNPLAVDSAGHLTRVFAETTDESRKEIVAGTARAIADLRESVGIDAHVSYGCLLGAVRDGHMIGHDSDSDLAYLSHHTHPADVVRESFRMERELRALGWKVVRMSGADLKLFLPLADGRTVHVDVFGAFYVGDTFYQMGGRSGHLPEDALTPASTVVLEGVELAAPADPERVLEFLYGPTWRVPDPSFQPVDPWPGLRRLDGWMRGVRTHVPHWNETYRNHRKDIPREASSFAKWTAERIPAAAKVVDVGQRHGAGLGVVLSPGSRRGVTRLLRSSAAVQPVSGSRGRASQTWTCERWRSTTCAPSSSPGPSWPANPNRRTSTPAGCSGGSTPTPGDNLWRLCSMSLRRGGSLFLEYAATRPGLRRDHPRPVCSRASAPSALVREITAAGGHVVHSEDGPGDDFYDGPDPCVGRLEVRWQPTDHCNTQHRGEPDEHERSPGRPQEVLPQGSRGACVGRATCPPRFTRTGDSTAGSPS